jgi:hypothetical protein
MDKIALDWNQVVRSLQNRSLIDPGVTCVAFFRKHRPWVFDTLIDWYHETIRSQLSEWLQMGWVTLTPASQIHVTLIGMEAGFDQGDLINRNLKRVKERMESRPRAMDLLGFAGYLQMMKLPIRLRFGGFSLGSINPYDARPPFERSFTVRSDGLIVAIGWPVLDHVIHPVLIDFRKGAERFQILHKYHVKETDGDNDAFFVIGAVTSKPWDDNGKPRNDYEGFVGALSETQTQIREALRTAAFEITLSNEHTCIVRYSSADLASVRDQDILPGDAVTAERLWGFYLSDRSE